MSAHESDTPAVARAEGPRRASTFVVAAAVLLAFLIACPCGIAAIVAARGFVGDARLQYAEWVEASSRVAWSGTGRFAVAQCPSGDGVPVVVGWDREDGDVRSIEGYRLAAVDPVRPVAWVVPIELGDLTSRLDGEWGSVLVPANGAFDAPVESLFSWSLEDGALEPVDSDEIEWARWEGPGGWSATPVAEPPRGAYPSELLLGSTQDSADERGVDVPGDLDTFDVLGWSVSGRYLALAEMLRSRSDAGSDPQGRRVFIVDAQSGRIAAEAEQRVTDGRGSPPVWAGWSDVLVWVDEMGEGNGSSPSLDHLQALEPRGAVRPGASALGLPSGAGWQATDRLVLCGSTSDALVLGIERPGSTTVWLARENSTVRVSTLPMAAAGPVYHPVGGLLMLSDESDTSEARTRTVLIHADHVAEETEVVWTGEWRTREE